MAQYQIPGGPMIDSGSNGLEYALVGFGFLNEPAASGANADISASGESVATVGAQSLASSNVSAAAEALATAGGAAIATADIGVTGEAIATMGAMSLAGADVSITGEANATFEGAGVQDGAGDLSMSGEATMAMGGASLASAGVDADGEADARFRGDSTGGVNRDYLLWGARRRKRKEKDDELIEILEAAGQTIDILVRGGYVGRTEIPLKRKVH